MNLAIAPHGAALVLLLLSQPAPAQAVQLQPPKVVSLSPNEAVATGLGDVDGDGQLDLAVLTGFPPSLFVLRNQGGSFTSGPIAFLPSAVDQGDVAAADLDGDGDVDFAACVAGSGQVHLIRTQGSGLFPAGAPLSVGLRPVRIVAGDLDEDGDVDLAIANEQSAFVSLLRNQGGLAFGVESLATTSSAVGVALADLDGDGDLDLAAVDGTNRELHTWLQQGGLLQPRPPLPLANGNIALVDLQAGDLDGDGDEDLIATGYTLAFNTLTGQVAYAVGGGQLQVGPLLPLKSGGGGIAALGDYDADGLLDLAISNVLGFHVAIHVNPGDGSFGGSLAHLIQLPFGAGDLEAGDVDGNGIADLVSCDQGADEVRVYLNVKAGTPCAAQVYCTAKPSSLGKAARIAPVGVPSRGTQGFGVALADALPASIAIAIESLSGPAAIPFQNGLLCVQPPTLRLPVRSTGASGATSAPVPITSSMVGSTRWYQWWFRDPAHPDGTGVALSDGLATTFCP